MSSLSDKQGSPSVDTVFPLCLFRREFDLAPLDRDPRPESTTVLLPGASGVLVAAAPSTTRPSPWSEKGRATGPALLSLGVCGVDGARVTRSALGVRGCVRSPLPDRPADDIRGVTGHGTVWFSTAVANTCRLVSPGTPEVR